MSISFGCLPALMPKTPSRRTDPNFPPNLPYQEINSENQNSALYIEPLPVR
jgi:hypothetical protein